MSDITGTEISQLPLGENLADDDLMLAVEDGISKKVEIEYLKNRFVGDLTLADLGDDSTHRLVTDAEKTAWSGKQDALTFDNTPTENSTNPVKSGGVYTALEGKANSSDLATVATSGSYNDLSNTPTIPSDAGDIDYDNTESGLTADDVQGAIDEVNGNIVDVEANPSGTATGELETIRVGSTIYNIVGGEPVYGEASGAIASFADGSANPLKSLVVDINPVQAGSGTPAPDNVRPISGWSSVEVKVAGKNLLPMTRGYNFTYNVEVGATLDVETDVDDWTDEGNGVFTITLGDWAKSGWLSEKLSAGKTVTLSALFVSGQARLCSYTLDSDYKVIRKFSTYNPIPNNTNYAFQITLEGEECYIAISVSGKGEKITVNNPQLEAGSTATSYEAYNSNTTTYSISWQTEAGDVYGGTLNVTTGELTVTHKKAVIDEDTNITTGPSGMPFKAEVLTGVEPVSSSYQLTGTICDSLDEVTQASTWGTEYTFARVSTTELVYFKLDNETTTIEQCKEYLQNNPLSFGYKLKEENYITYNLTPTEVDSLLGNNNILANSGNVKVVYIRDLNLFLNQLDARVKALENA